MNKYLEKIAKKEKNDKNKKINPAIPAAILAAEGAVLANETQPQTKTREARAILKGIKAGQSLPEWQKAKGDNKKVKAKAGHSLPTWQNERQTTPRERRLVAEKAYKRSMAFSSPKARIAAGLATGATVGTGLGLWHNKMVENKSKNSPPMKKVAYTEDNVYLNKIAAEIYRGAIPSGAREVKATRVHPNPPSTYVKPGSPSNKIGVDTLKRIIKKHPIATAGAVGGTAITAAGLALSKRKEKAN